MITKYGAPPSQVDEDAEDASFFAHVDPKADTERIVKKDSRPLRPSGERTTRRTYRPIPDPKG